MPDLERYFRDSREALERVAADRQSLAAILAITETIAKAFRAGGKLLLAGNGGSAADAQHIAAEFLVALYARPRAAAGDRAHHRHLRR